MQSHLCLTMEKINPFLFNFCMHTHAEGSPNPRSKKMHANLLRSSSLAVLYSKWDDVQTVALPIHLFLLLHSHAFTLSSHTAVQFHSAQERNIFLTMMIEKVSSSIQLKLWLNPMPVGFARLLHLFYWFI